MNMPLLFRLFFEFFRIGFIAVGGGPATLPYLMELTDRTDWFTMEELTNMIAVSESTPGPLGLNMATYAGFRTLGTFGGAVSSLGLAIPSIIVISIIAEYFSRMNENKKVQAAFRMIRPAVTAIIAASVTRICQVSLFRFTEGGWSPAFSSMALCAVIFGLLQVKKLKKFHPSLWFLVGAVIGLVFRF